MADYTLSARITGDSRGFTSAFDRARASAGQLSEDVQNLGKKMSDMSKSMMDVGGKMTIGITAPLVLAGKKAIDYASDLQEVQNVVDVTFGDAASQIEEFSKSAGKSFGLSELQAKQFTGTLGAMLKSSGMTGKGVTDMSTSLVGLSADMASFYNLEHEEAFDKIRAGISGETEPLKQLGINMSVANLEAYAMAEGISTAYDEMSQAEQVQVRYGYLMQATADAQGDFSRTSESHANVMKRLQLAIANMSNVVGTMLLPYATKAASTVTELIDSFQTLSPTVQRNAVIATILVAALGPLLMLIGAIGIGLGALVTGFGFLISPIGLVIVGVVALVAAFATAMLRSEEFRERVMGAFNKVKEVISGVVETLKPILQNMWTGALASATTFADGLGGKFMTAFAAIGNAFSVVSAAVGAFVGYVSPILFNLWTTVSGAIGQFVTFAIPILQTVWDAITNGASTVSEGFGAKVLTVFETVKSVIMTVVGVVAQFVMSIVNGFTSAGGSVSSLGALFMVFSPLLKIGMMVLSQFGPQIAAGFMEIASLVVPILTTLGTMLGQLAAAVIPMVMNVVATLIPIIVMLATAIMNIISAVLPVLLNLFMQLVPVVMSLVETVIGLVTQLMPLVATIIGALVPVLMMLIDVILNIVQAVAPALIAIIGAIIAIFQAILPVIMSILTVVIHVFAMIIATITPIIAFVAGIITSIIAIIAPIVTFIAGVIASIFKVITPVITFVNGVFQTVFTIISGIWQSILAYITAAIQSISNTIAQVSGVVSGVFNGIWSKIAAVMDKVRTKIQGVFDAIKTSWSGLKTFVSGVFTGIGDNMADLVSRVKGFVNGVIGGINSAVSLINKIPGVSIGKIPYLARGTDDWQGGFARINEGGRGELVNLPNGAQVIPHDVSMKYAREAGQASARQSNGRQEVMAAQAGNHNQSDDRPIYMVMDKHVVAKLLKGPITNIQNRDSIILKRS